MSTITVNESKRCIEVTKDFYKRASIFNTQEYVDLRKVRCDFPDFKVVANRATKRDSFKGLTFAYMKSYIKNHDEDESIMKEFKELRGESEEAKEVMATSLSYGEIKTWFLNKYPDIETFHKNREDCMNKVKKEREAKREKAKSEALGVGA